MATIEFYIGSSAKHIAVVDCDAVPRDTEFVNIRGRQYSVSRVTWAIDNADDVMNSRMRVCVELIKRD